MNYKFFNQAKAGKIMKRTKAFLFTAVMILCVIMLGGCASSDVPPSDIKYVDDLPGKIIGTQIGTTGDACAKDYIKKGSQVRSFNKGADAIMALKQCKVDCVIIDVAPAEKFVAINSDLSILEEDFALEDYAVCIAKDNLELLEKVNNAIAQIKSDGTLDKIINNYIGDNIGETPYVSPKNTDRSNGVLRIATNAAFEPYEYFKNGKIVGIDAEMMQAVADILGMELEIHDMMFDSIITAVQSGKADVGAAGMTVEEDRQKNVNFTDTYTTSRQVIIVRNGNSDSAQKFIDRFNQNFIEDERWAYIVTGLLTTLVISFFATIIGIAFGFILGNIRFSCDHTGKLKPLNWLCKLYITVIRGTPAMIQLLIIYYVIFASSDISAVIVAIISFGLNSSAYIAEVIRSGVTSIDIGQIEAGRSLGFSYIKTMRYFILPQAVKNVLPALGNEFIVLLKETSISGYIGIRDLTRGGDIIRVDTYDAFMPLIAVALIYLVIVILLGMLMRRLERSLKNDE